MEFGPVSSFFPAVAGQEVRAAIFVRFFNDYSPTGVIAFSFADGSIDGTFGYPATSEPGGTFVSVQTGTDWAPGPHTVEIEVSDGESLPKILEFPILIKEVGTFTLFHAEENLHGQSFVKQGVYNLGFEILDPEGNPDYELSGYSTPNLPVSYSSSSPQDIEVFEEPGIWGGLLLLVHDSASSATIRATLPDGSTHDFAVSAAIPSSPRITNAYFWRNPMSNLPGYGLDPRENQNAFVLEATDSFTGSRGISFPNGFAREGGDFIGSGSTHGYSFYAGEQVLPGKYLWSAGGTVDGERVSAPGLLTVYNDPATGLISGRVTNFVPGHDHSLYGIIELYHEDEELAMAMNIYSDSIDEYSLARVPPGRYKVRWLPDPPSLPQWYPNASGFAEAEVIEVTAGSTHEGIDFLLSPPVPALTPPVFQAPPAFDPASGEFSIQIEADDNTPYALERSYTLRENSWVEVDRAWGWNGSAELTDSEAREPNAFYRVRQL